MQAHTDIASLTTEIKAEALRLGFDMAGVASAAPSLFRAEYLEWLAQGRHGEMAYLAHNPDRRLDSRLLLPDARSIIVVAMNYYCDTEEGPGAPQIEEGTAIFARYARGEDYHDVMTHRLKKLLDFLKEKAGEGTEGRVYVDAGPILERETAQRAGLGWFGKNTMLINTRRGSYFFLGEIVTNALLEPDEPSIGGCGTCTRCLDACPTNALTAPFQLDARLCISYLTIEQKGSINEELRPVLGEAGNRIFGCDICQEVCPFNLRRSVPTFEPAFQPRAAVQNARLADILLMSEKEFREKFKGSPVKRAKRRGLLRNAAVALAASDEPKAKQALEQALNDREELVKENANWALEQMQARSADIAHVSSDTDRNA